MYHAQNVILGQPGNSDQKFLETAAPSAEPPARPID